MTQRKGFSTIKFISTNGSISSGSGGLGRVATLEPSPSQKINIPIHQADEQVSEDLTGTGVILPTISSKFPLRPSQLVDMALDHLHDHLYDHAVATREAKTLLRTLANLQKREDDYLRLWHGLRGLGVVK